MSTIRKEYLCQVTVVEGRELASTDESGTCDPFVKVTCGNAEPQATTTENGNNNPSWNQSFTFSNLSLTDTELETWELKIECIDFNMFMTNVLIGSFSIGLATLNRNSNHEFYNTWISLLHPEYGATPRGYLLVNCFIVGPDDVPPAHAIGEQLGLDEDPEESDDDDDLLTTEQKQIKKMKKQAIGIVKTPMIAKKMFQLTVNIYKADKLAKIGGKDASTFVSVRTCGIVDRTHVMESTSSPVWNIKLSFPASTPIMNDRITIRMWDYRSRSRDKLIATLPELPNDHDYFNISTLISRGGVLPCRWFNLYGQSEEEDTIWNDLKKITGLAKKTYTGTCFLGRVLLSMSIAPNDDPESGVSKANQYREPGNQVFQAKVTLYEMKNADDCGDKVRIRFSIGQFSIYSKYSKKKEREDERSGEKMVFFTWGSSYSGELLPEIKEPFPKDPAQTPDVIIDLFSDGLLGEKRIGYIRRPVTEFLGNDSPIWIPFKSIDTHSNIGLASPGLVLASIFYGVESPENKGPKLKPRKVERYLYWNIYSGLDMASSIADEDTDLFLKIYCGDIVVPMDSKNGYKPPEGMKSSKNPIWKWSGDRQMQLHEDLHFEQNLRVEVYNKVKRFGFYDGVDDIGQFSIPLHAVAENKSKKPNFYHVVNAKDEEVSQGRIIASFFISKEKLAENPCNDDDMELKNCDIQIALVGIRGLKPPYEELKITMEIPGYAEGDKAIVVTCDKLRDKSNPSILKIKAFENILLPPKLIYLPAIHIKIEDTALLSWNKCFTYVSLINYCSWVEDSLEKREALELYNRNFTKEDLIEQAPKEINEEGEKKKVVKLEEMTDYGSEQSSSDSEGDDIYNKNKKTVPMDDIFDPKNSKIMPRIQFDKSKEDESQELELRETTKNTIMNDLSERQEEAKQSMKKTGKISEELRGKIKKLEKELEVLEVGVMNEARFLRKDDEDDEGGFQYGRPIYKTGLLDDIQKPPYHRFPLFRKTKNSDKLSVHKVGEPIGAVLKAMINIKVNDSKEDPLADPDSLKWDFNFFHPVFQNGDDLLQSFQDVQVVVRLYILRGLSLSAVDNAPDLKALAGGLDALSSASSYPEILLGEKKLKNVKYYFDNGVIEKDNLNPEYFRTYELSGVLPSDFNLQITIWNQNSISFDNIIGTTGIDIEDRYFGNDYINQMLMIEKAKERINRDLDDPSPDKRALYNNLKKKIKIEQAKLKDSKYIAPVEYRPLKVKGKSTAQGMLELFVEILDLQTAKLVPVSKIVKPVPEKYELRLIVWKCEGVPLGENEAIDPFFKVQFDPSGWLAESLEKETDVHCGSEDGHGIYNWRMKFEFELPSNFARIRIVCFNFSTFGTDTMISEVVLDLGKYFRRVMKEGKLNQEEQWVDLMIPGEKKFGGKVLISFTILSLSEANATPVGEGQDEPNRDPVLEKPEEGRGVMDFLKGTALDVSKWSLFNFGLLKKLLLLLSMAGTVVVLFIYPGLISKPK